MKRLLLFGGAAEGRALVERLADLPAAIAVSVAMDYGRDLLRGIADRAEILTGRLDADAMTELMRRERYAAVIDATHPYAVEASANIATAAAAAGIVCLRLARPASEWARCVRVPSVAAAAERVAGLAGNVLVATGSRDLDAYVSIPGYAERLYPRVLPAVESLRRCAELGFRRDHVIAMQGPFGRELDAALMRRFAIAVLVTKDGGEPGGFRDKMLAAEDVGAVAVVIERPAGDGGLDPETLVRRVARMVEEER